MLRKVSSRGDRPLLFHKEAQENKASLKPRSVVRALGRVVRYWPGLPVIPVSLQFVGAAQPRPDGFAAHYLREDSMTRLTREESANKPYFHLSVYVHAQVWNALSVFETERQRPDPPIYFSTLSFTVVHTATAPSVGG